MKAKIVLTHRVFPETVALLQPHCELILNETSHTLPQGEILSRCADADAMMAFMPDHVDEDFLRHCPKLKVIGAALKGYDNFDAEACTNHDVWLSIVPDFLTAPTADLTMAMLLSISRHVLAADQYVRKGNFQGWRPVFYGTGLSGETVGLIGMGNVGQAIARRLQGFDAEVIYYDCKRLDLAEEKRLGVEYAPLSHVVEHSTYLVPMLPYNEETRHLIDAQMIAAMPKHAYLINVCRGSVVDEDAVVSALTDGHLAGYAADVFEFEEWARADRPLGIHPELLAMQEKTLFTPHLGSAVIQSRKNIELTAARNIIEALSGNKPTHAVNDIRMGALK